MNFIIPILQLGGGVRLRVWLAKGHLRREVRFKLGARDFLLCGSAFFDRRGVGVI